MLVSVGNNEVTVCIMRQLNWGISGSPQHQFVKTDFGSQVRSQRFRPPAPGVLLSLLSLTHCNFVVSSAPAGCDIPLLLIILNQKGLSPALRLFCRRSSPIPLQETVKMEKNETCAQPFQGQQ